MDSGATHLAALACGRRTRCSSFSWVRTSFGRSMAIKRRITFSGVRGGPCPVQPVMLASESSHGLQETEIDGERSHPATQRLHEPFQPALLRNRPSVPRLL